MTFNHTVSSLNFTFIIDITDRLTKLGLIFFIFILIWAKWLVNKSQWKKLLFLIWKINFWKKILVFGCRMNDDVKNKYLSDQNMNSKLNTVWLKIVLMTACYWEFFLLGLCSIHWIYWNQIHKLKTKFQNFCCWHFNFFIHFWKRGKRKLFFPF